MSCLCSSINFPSEVFVKPKYIQDKKDSNDSLPSLRLYLCRWQDLIVLMTSEEGATDRKRM